MRTVVATTPRISPVVLRYLRGTMPRKRRGDADVALEKIGGALAGWVETGMDEVRALAAGFLEEMAKNEEEGVLVARAPRDAQRGGTEAKAQISARA